MKPLDSASKAEKPAEAAAPCAAPFEPADGGQRHPRRSEAVLTGSLPKNSLKHTRDRPFSASQDVLWG